MVLVRSETVVLVWSETVVLVWSETVVLVWSDVLLFSQPNAIRTKRKIRGENDRIVKSTPLLATWWRYGEGKNHVTLRKRLK